MGQPASPSLESGRFALAVSQCYTSKTPCSILQHDCCRNRKGLQESGTKQVAQRGIRNSGGRGVTNDGGWWEVV